MRETSQKGRSRTPKAFGKGAVKGIAGSEAANNSATGDAMVPTHALGIPGPPTASVTLAVLMVHGLRPGPALFTERAYFAHSKSRSMMMVNVLFHSICLYGAMVIDHVTLIPVHVLWV